MITENYCKEILKQYPEYITKDQMYRICHISKKTCSFLLESGLVPNIDSGMKTRLFKIKLPMSSVISSKEMITQSCINLQKAFIQGMSVKKHLLLMKYSRRGT